MFGWFETKNILSGNPEDIIEKFNELQKKKIIRLPVWRESRKYSNIDSLDELHPADNSLLLRRKQINIIRH